MQHAFISIISLPESKFQEVSKFWFTLHELGQKFFDACLRYMFVVYSSGGCIKNLARKKSSKWPPFKMATTILNYIELSEKHTYLGFNASAFFKCWYCNTFSLCVK